MITHYNLRFAGYYSAWQCALRDDDVYLTVMPAFHIDCQCTAAMAAFSAGATFVLVEKYSARAFWGQVQKYRATITECIPMMIRTLMVQPPSANDRQHRLREVMFYLNLSEQEKDAFCERFSVRLLTSYGMTETIVGIIGDRLAINDAGRRLVGRAFATKRRSATITIVPSRLVSSVKSVLKAYQGKPSSKSIFSTRKPLRKCWKPMAGYIPAIPDTATKRAFFISSIAAAI